MRTNRSLLTGIAALLIACIFPCGAQDLVSGGSNSWVFHTPDDGRTSLYIAPGVNSGNWIWNNNFEFQSSGSAIFNGSLGVTGLYQRNPADFQIGGYDPGNGSGYGIKFTAVENGFNFETHYGSWGSRFYISDNGNIGIGTTNLISTFNVNAVDGAAIMLKSNDINIASFWVNNTSSTWHGGGGIGLNMVATGADIDFQTGNSVESRLKIMNNGSVGIGITQPTSKFHIHNGSIKLTQVRTGVNSELPMIIASQHVNAPQNYGYAGIYHIEDGSAGFGQAGGLIFKTSENDLAPVSRMTIRANGNVGIGTPSPQAKLDVSGSIKIPAATSTDNLSPGLVLLSNDDFLYDGDYINHYGFGFHHFSGSALNGPNAYVSGFFGLDLFTEGQNRFRILQNGNIGIGVINPTAKLEVDGTIISEEIKVQVVNGPDYVFSPDYELRTLEETKAYIEENQHLPEIPSAAEMETNGVALGEMNMLLLKKIEELTLYLIEKDKQIQDQNARIQELAERVENLEN